MTTKKIKASKDLSMLFWTIVSATIQSISLSSFSIRAGLYPGGFTGVARILSDLARDYLGTDNLFSILYLSLNVVVAIITFKYIGKKFTIFSVLHIILVSILTPLFKPLIEVEDILLYSVFGGILSGFATGLALQNDLSSGGTDFIAIYFSNKYHKSTWNYVLFFNAVVLIVAGLIYGWEKALYSIILQFCNTQVIKRMHKRYVHQTLTIITEHKDEVVASILSGTRHGITELNAKGAYMKKDEYYLYMVVNAFETQEVCEAVLKADPKAFINIQDSKEIVGNFYQKPLD